MDAILKEIGYSQGRVGERMKALAKDPRYKFPEGDKGRAEILAFINNRLEWIRAQMPRAFNTVVRPNMEVKRLPPEEEPGAPAAYGGAGSIDGRIPGRYWINLRTSELHSKYSLADLTFHESIPGHIWQGEYTHQMPLIRQLLAFNAFSEGWGLYAEQLADELGAYDQDHEEHFHLYFETTDIAAVAGELKRKGVPFVQDIHETAWRTREFIIRDPDGHTLYFGQAL